MRRIAVALACWALWAPLATAEEKPIDFAHQIAPLIQRHCGKCHTNGVAKGDFSLDTRDAVLNSGLVAVGKADESELIARVTSDDPDLRMPPADELPLNDAQVSLLRAWIDQGFAWEDGFTFKSNAYQPPLRPRRPELPPVRDGREHPVDRIVDQYFIEHEVARPAPVDDVTFLRRVYFDLVGLPPSPEDREAFLADTASDRRERLVDRLLADDRGYADHWLTFWNDLLRNDYVGTGYIDGGRKQITGWLYPALYENKPYDQFVRELISPTPESEGFVGGIKWRGAVNASQVRPIQFAQNVGQVFLGINLKCASCHDSFIDSWKLTDAYGLAAIYSTDPLEIHRCDKPTGEAAQAAFLFSELGTVDPAAPQPERLRQLAALMTHEDNGRLTRTIVNRLWHRLMGRGIVHPVDAMGTRPWSEDLLDYLAVRLVDEGYDLRRLMRVIVTSQAYQSQAVMPSNPGSAEEFVYRGPLPKRMTAEQFLDAVWIITGTGPQQSHAPVALDDSGPRQAGLRPAAEGVPMVRAALVKSDLLMRSLGRPNREQVVTSRPEQLTTLEAIDLANGEMLARTLRSGAGNILASKVSEPRPHIERLFLHALSRPPTEDERAVAMEITGSPVTPAGMEDLLWTVFMLPEFQLIR